jgi:cytochrome b subunit of formate dehydrogenase
VLSHSFAAAVVVLLYLTVSGIMLDASLKASSSPWKTCYHQCGVSSVAVTV